METNTSQNMGAGLKECRNNSNNLITSSLLELGQEDKLEQLS